MRVNQTMQIKDNGGDGGVQRAGGPTGWALILISHFGIDKNVCERVFVKNVSPLRKKQPKKPPQKTGKAGSKGMNLLNAFLCCGPGQRRVYRLQGGFLPEEKINTLHQPNAAKSWLRFVSLSPPPAALAGSSFWIRVEGSAEILLLSSPSLGVTPVLGSNQLRVALLRN